jgi:hypothetical protein
MMPESKPEETCNFCTSSSEHCTKKAADSKLLFQSMQHHYGPSAKCRSASCLQGQALITRLVLPVLKVGDHLLPPILELVTSNRCRQTILEILN